MKKHLFVLLTLLVLAGMVLGACQSAEPVVEEVEEMVETEAVETEKVEEAEETMDEEPEVVEAAGPEALDAAFERMLTSMAGYNVVKSADDLQTEMSADQPPFVLDVRSAEEVEDSGHIEGAFHIPLNELAQHTDLLPSLDTPIVTYCAGGWRATIAMTALQGMGWEDVRALKIGFADWADGGYPVAEGLPTTPVLNTADADPALAAAADAYLVGIKDHGSKYGMIDAESLNTALGENADLVVIDVRRQEELDEKGTIDAPNWMHIPLEDFAASRADWPADMDTPITIYCGSGHRSTMAMTIMFAYGYSDVTSLVGGFGGWADAGFSVLGGAPSLDDTYGLMLETMQGYNTVKSADDLMLEMAEDQPPFVLDVRSMAEVEESGHIEGAYHIALHELALHTDQLPSFDTPIVTYCAGGWRATIAMTALHAMGWEDVRALKIGFADWVDGGYPVVGGVPGEVVLDAAAPHANLVQAVDSALTDIANLGSKFGITSADTLNTALLEKPDLILIDVRKTSELEESGVIAVEGQTLLTIPLEEFVANQDLWPEDKDAEIVVYCGSGHRSTMAMTMLLTYGYTNVTSLSTGFGGWVDAGYPVAEYAMP